MTMEDWKKTIEKNLKDDLKEVFSPIAIFNVSLETESEPKVVVQAKDLDTDTLSNCVLYIKENKLVYNTPDKKPRPYFNYLKKWLENDLSIGLYLSELVA